MVDLDRFRNKEEKEKAKRLEIKDTEYQIKISEEYLKRLRKKLKELKTKE